MGELNISYSNKKNGGSKFVLFKVKIQKEGDLIYPTLMKVQKKGGPQRLVRTSTQGGWDQHMTFGRCSIMTIMSSYGILGTLQLCRITMLLIKLDLFVW